MSDIKKKSEAISDCHINRFQRVYSSSNPEAPFIASNDSVFAFAERLAQPPTFQAKLTLRHNPSTSRLLLACNAKKHGSAEITRPEELFQRFTKLNTATLGIKALHKYLLLFAIGQRLKGKDRMIPYGYMKKGGLYTIT